MERLKISREEAVLEASRFGWTIPEEQFGVKKVARGRAKKLVDLKEKKCEKVSSGRCRGRPKSDKKTVNSSASNDLIGDLVTKAKSRIEFEDESNSEVDVVTTSENDCVIEQLGSEIFAEVLSEVVSEVPYEIADEVLSDISGAESPAEIPAEIPASIAASISEPVTVAEVVTEKSKSSKESKSQLKAKKEAEKAAEKARKKAEKEAEKAAEKEAEKSSKKAEKAAAKALKKSEAKLEKESTKLQKKPVTKEVKTQDTIVSAVATEQSQDVSTSNSEEDDSEEEVKKQDTIVSAVATEQSQDVSRSNSEEDSEEEEEVEVEVKTWHHKCKKYLKSSNHKVYDKKTQKQIGIWNEEEDTIEEISEDEEEDSD